MSDIIYNLKNIEQVEEKIIEARLIIYGMFKEEDPDSIIESGTTLVECLEEVVQMLKKESAH